MPVDYYPDNESHTVYVLHCSDPWTWGDFDGGIRGCYAEIIKENHTVDFVIWYDGQIPPGNALAHLRRAGVTQPKKVYRTVVVARSLTYMKRLSQVLDTSQRWDGPDFFTSMEEARAWLAAQQAGDERYSDTDT